MATCGQMIEGNVVAFSCDLDAGHAGPHRAYENARSVRERERWEREQTHATSGLGQFQGRAETTAERYTENPTAVPGPEEVQRFARPVVVEEDANGTRFRQATSAEAKVAEIPSEQGPGPDEVYLLDISKFDLTGVFDGQPPTQAKMQVRSISPSGTVRISFADYPSGVGPEYDLSREQFHTLAIRRVDLDLMPAAPHVGDYGDRVEEYLAGPQPTKQRPGDQVLPTQTGEESVQARIIRKSQALVESGAMPEDTFRLIEQQMLDSIKVGTERYGSALQTFNGRDALQDAAEEARDLYVYLNSLIDARATQRGRLVDVVAQAIRAADGNHTMGAGALAEVAVDAILQATGPLGAT